MSVRVLLVEDEPDIRLIARAALLRAGFEVLTAENGAEALRIAAAERPDLVLLDWMLPELDGFETCARLKADPSTRPIPVVFLTARTRAADVARCTAAGALGCIPKPFNPLVLGDQVRALWEGSADRTPVEPRE
jgi:DNA-binding response OmpR family regulator